VAITIGERRFTVAVTALADRRGPASVAATLYEETPESMAERARRAEERRLGRPLGAELDGRPTKRDRRRLDALRRGQRDRRSN
jgi:ribosome-associated heat shock protein Hsp15